MKAVINSDNCLTKCGTHVMSHYYVCYCHVETDLYQRCNVAGVT